MQVSFAGFELSVDPPTAPSLSGLARRWWVWVLLAGVALGVAGIYFYLQRTTSTEEARATAPLEVQSSPPGAEVRLDGREQGVTPVTLHATPGTHELRLKLAGYASQTQHLSLAEGTNPPVESQLWLETPETQRLRPAYPGASIAAAEFLADGRVALTIVLPPGEERQLWVLGAGGAVQRVGPPMAKGAVAVSLDGQRVAYLTQSPASSALDRLDEVWITRAQGGLGEKVYALPSGNAAERLVDLSFAPTGERLLLVTRVQQTSGTTRTRLLRLDLATGAAERQAPLLAGEPTELSNLPSEIVPSSYSWSLDGSRVAFLTRAGSLTSLCLVSLDGAEFRYLADLGRDDTNPLPLPPITWAADNARLVYAAPTQDHPGAGGFLFGSKESLGLFAVELPRAQARRLGASEGQSPALRADGSLVALARAKGDGAIALRAYDSSGEPQDQGSVSLKSSGVFAARWDVAHGQLLLAQRGALGAAGTPADFWLVRFRPETEVNP